MDTEKLAESLMEELNCETVFTIPILGGIEVDEAVVVTWIIMAAILLLSIYLTHGFRVHNPCKRQLLMETIYLAGVHFFEDLLGEKGKRYISYLISTVLYIGIANIIGLFGMKSPTKDLNVTAALALMSIILVEYAGIHEKGIKRWMKSFTEPIAIITPINIMEVFIRPLSLCMRLFGNVLGSVVVMALIELLIPVFVPVVFSLYFDIFDGLLQAYVFVFLTSLYIKEAID